MQSACKRITKGISPWATNKKRQTPLGRRVCRGAQVPGQTERKTLRSLCTNTHVPFLSSRRVQWRKQIIKAVGERKNPLLIRLSANSNNPLWLSAAASRNQQ